MILSPSVCRSPPTRLLRVCEVERRRAEKAVQLRLVAEHGRAAACDYSAEPPATAARRTDSEGAGEALLRCRKGPRTAAALPRRRLTPLHLFGTDGRPDDAAAAALSSSECGRTHFASDAAAHGAELGRRSLLLLQLRSVNEGPEQAWRGGGFAMTYWATHRPPCRILTGQRRGPLR